jgi:hypothetical protein
VLEITGIVVGFGFVGVAVSAFDLVFDFGFFEASRMVVVEKHRRVQLYARLSTGDIEPGRSVRDEMTLRSVSKILVLIAHFCTRLDQSEAFAKFRQPVN